MVSHQLALIYRRTCVDGNNGLLIGVVMKYFLFVLVVFSGYIYYERSTPWNDADLEGLVIEKNGELCVMPELLEQYNLTTTRCEELFTANMDYCLVQAEQKYPGEEFESKAQILEAFNDTLNCIVVKMENSE